MKTIAVYCASSTQIRPSFFDAAAEVGRLLAESGIRVVTGAGNMGLMNAVQNAALEAGGTVVGVIPEFMIRENWHHTGLSELIVTPDMHTRKQTIADMSNGCIALPGGCGTFEELLEVITWKQLGLYLNPIVVLNQDGYYDPLLAQLQKAVDENFMRNLHANIWNVASTPAEAVDMVLNTPQWDPSIRKFAKY
ncbi:MAG: TIGR00730 family Rossman fold protein [Bacteroidaceae bacterium]|nr:TIGR00730 family Rossman fold protein [Bacteroidaceae bacterium]